MEDKQPERARDAQLEPAVRLKPARPRSLSFVNGPFNGGVIGNRREWARHEAARRRLGVSNDVRVYANIGRRHPDYGLTPAEHVLNKRMRKERLRAASGSTSFLKDGNGDRRFMAVDPAARP